MKTRAQKELEFAFIQGDKINRMAALKLNRTAAVIKARKQMGEK